ncbi:Holliday junction branch migration protein RuvA [Oleiharenicola lentus]|jgi:Holliday junction DNA helicase RuvA|uniref:Holliday junction branch migration complex subunit RuvA n=1 Tax=Oleiharenicola lentus TaxID=2508720 RepID=A0A4Q1CAL7_9BACT|nr:Holliday junction branch migration protein RuvA [Oleiharenicola lentus]RXK56084.1 Holliday junction branch migration protein RuvA [Oleiharenicola lentus]
MITSVSGILVSATPLVAVIETGGLGYEINIPVTTAERLPQPGQVAKLHTLAVYREDSQTLYGFATVEERNFFRLLVEKVTGVGPKMALSVMSKLSLPTLKSAIAAGDVGLLAKCPGIGRKTAERLVIELRDKLNPADLGAVPASLESSTPVADNRVNDAVLALTALGYKAADADKAVRQAWVALGPKATTEALIKKALG